ncbi:MAG: hypothetical protein KatS3mg077_2080 [Candidatus Binatia bacterium]|nr:MAG: hypothetical protein KatS3mg077_2080 [Candidatus Binatia bacterium]
MERKDEELIQQLIGQDEELRRYYEEHLELERQLAELNRRLYLTPQQELEKKRLQKLKLAGKDKIMEILARYRQTSRPLSA